MLPPNSFNADILKVWSSISDISIAWFLYEIHIPQALSWAPLTEIGIYD